MEENKNIPAEVDNNNESKTDIYKSGKSNKIMLGIIVALSVAIIGLCIFIFAGGKNKKDSTTTETTVDNATSQDASSEGGSAETATTQAEQQETGEQLSCYVSMDAGDGWEGSGKYYNQYTVSIHNNTSYDIKNWSIKIPVAGDVTIDSSWNGTFSNDGGTITITPVEYNGTVAANSTLADIGFIVVASSKSDIDAMASAAELYVDGQLYVSTAVDEGQDNTEETATETTEETTTEAPSVPAEAETGTPLDNHGKLSVEGTNIVDENGDVYQLKGVSTHGMAWFPDYVNKDAFQTFRDDWGANIIRLAMYTAEYAGYCEGGDKEYLKSLIDTGVQAATELGMYVIVDWHILHDLTPHKYKDDAKAFFEEMSAKYKDYDNVIYEICNEPNGGTTWADVKSYAEEIIPIIRANDPDAIIIVGTPNWSQDVDIAAQDPITGYDNIMYAVHFYAATHTDNIRNKVTTALDAGLPIIVSEFSICDASGNGAIDYNQADLWFHLIEANNMSYVGWNISNKDETSSIIKSSCTKLSGWTEDELSESGVWLRNQIKGNN